MVPSDKLELILLMKLRKRIGPIRKPCRTPDVTGFQQHNGVCSLDNLQPSLVGDPGNRSTSVCRVASDEALCQMLSPCPNI